MRTTQCQVPSHVALVVVAVDVVVMMIIATQCRRDVSRSRASEEGELGAFNDVHTKKNLLNAKLTWLLVPQQPKDVTAKVMGSNGHVHFSRLMTLSRTSPSYLPDKLPSSKTPNDSVFPNNGRLGRTICEILRITVLRDEKRRTSRRTSGLIERCRPFCTHYFRLVLLVKVPTPRGLGSLGDEKRKMALFVKPLDPLRLAFPPIRLPGFSA
ncbi:hypothetical protein BDP55DRAFT_637145 [Colletotrichum godetiae]|uniref:Uncharacterized protein n=1 Tax=Colletotrichum godetiae TaxID=1209918 RepID=A0AAJ0AB75_9PEZI|nr:uncharacterized protein BDP55DRAFT_637145 [Colletotrichum godetiae]KAK1659273.1 hypothetical protein BDP55DRAFT_637145 [Colletotrichum godetiae]